MQIGSVVRWRNTDIGVVVEIDEDYANVRFCPLDEHKVKLIHQSELEVIEYYE
jgi:hypothetical protein